MKPAVNTRSDTKFERLRDLVDNPDFKDHAKLRAKARQDAPSGISLYSRDGNRTALQNLENRLVGRGLARQTVLDAVDEVLRDYPALRESPNAMVAVGNLRDHAGRSGHDLDATILKTNLAKIVEIRLKRAATDGASGQPNGAGAAAKTHTPRTPKQIAARADRKEERMKELKRFATQMAPESRANLAKILGLNPSDPCIDKFKDYVNQKDIHRGTPPNAQDHAHVIEFARRWTAAMNGTPTPADNFGWGKAVNAMVRPLNKLYLGNQNSHEPSCAYTAGVLDSDELKEAVSKLPALLGGSNQESISELAQSLGQAIKVRLRSAPKVVQMSFVASAGTKYKEELKQELLKSSGFKDWNIRSNKVHGDMDRFLDAAWQSAMIQMPDRVASCDNAKTPMGREYQRPKEVIVGGLQYKFSREIAEAGFGVVNLFTSTDGKKSIVIKSGLAMSNGPAQDVFANAQQEVEGHIAATTLAHANVIGIEGVLRMPDGSTAIALEYAPGGNAFDGIDRLNEIQKNGIPLKGGGSLQLQPAQIDNVKLTLAQDMLKGLAQLQKAGVSHVDLKSPNMFITHDGSIVFGDMGTARYGLDQTRKTLPVDMPMWRDPLMAKAFAAMDSKIHDLNKSIKKAAKLLGPGAPVKQATEEARQRSLQEIGPATFSGKAADSWSVGVTAYMMFCGREPFDGFARNAQGERIGKKPFATITTDQQNAFLAEADVEKRRAALFPGEEGAKVPKEIQDLILGLMDPVADERISPEKALSLNIFKGEGVASPETRDLIAMINDPEKLTARGTNSAKNALGRFADSKQWSSDTLKNLAQQLNLPSDDPCIKAFQTYAQDCLNSGEGPLGGGAVSANVLEFARRWTAATHDATDVSTRFGWGTAVNSMVALLMARHPGLASHEPSCAHTPLTLASAAFKNAMKLLPASTHFNEQQAVNSLAGEISKEIAAAPRPVQVAFAASSGAAYKEQMLKRLFPRDISAADRVAAQSFLDTVYLQALKGLPDQVKSVGLQPQLDPQKPTIKQIARVKINGLEYDFVRPLAEGGYGAINLFKTLGPNGEEKFIVLKTASPDKDGTEKRLAEAQEEIKVHLAATALGSGHVIGLEGVVRAPDGSLAIALEYAPNGGLDDAIGKLHDAIEKDDLDEETADAVKLNMAKNVLGGLAQLKQSDVAHLDIKGANMVIDADGRVRVCDFGMSSQGVKMTKVRELVAQPRWRDPLMDTAFAKLNKDVAAIMRTVNPKYRDDYRVTGSAFANALPKLTPENQAKVAKLLESGARIDGAAADAWSAGVVLYQVYANKLPFDTAGTFMSDIEDLQVKFINMNEGDRWDYLFGDKSAGKDIPRSMRNLIMAMLDPDPAKRITPQEALAKPMFQHDVIDSPETQQAIQDIAQRPKPVTAAVAVAAPPV